MLADVSGLEIPTQYCSPCGGEGMFLGMLKKAVGCFMPNFVQASMFPVKNFLCVLLTSCYRRFNPYPANVENMVSP